jgi:hypothetical protein
MTLEQTLGRLQNRVGEGRLQEQFTLLSQRNLAKNEP